MNLSHSTLRAARTNDVKRFKRLSNAQCDRKRCSTQLLTDGAQQEQTDARHNELKERDQLAARACERDRFGFARTHKNDNNNTDQRIRKGKVGEQNFVEKHQRNRNDPVKRNDARNRPAASVCESDET